MSQPFPPMQLSNIYNRRKSSQLTPRFSLGVTKGSLKVLLTWVSLFNSLMKQKFAFEVSQYLKQWLCFKPMTSFYCPSLPVIIPSCKSFPAMENQDLCMPWENAGGYSTGHERWRQQRRYGHSGRSRLHKLHSHQVSKVS